MGGCCKCPERAVKDGRGTSLREDDGRLHRRGIDGASLRRWRPCSAAAHKLDSMQMLRTT